MKRAAGSATRAGTVSVEEYESKISKRFELERQEKRPVDPAARRFSVLFYIVIVKSV